MSDWADIKHTQKTSKEGVHMNITVSISTATRVLDTGGLAFMDRQDYRKEMSVEDYGDVILGATKISDREGKWLPEDLLEVVPELLPFEEVLDDLDRPGRFVFESLPEVFVKKLGTKWLRIVIWGIPNLWLFYLRKEEDSPYELVPIPDGCRVRPDDGAIFAKFGEYGTYAVTDDDPLYPWVLLNPKLHAALAGLTNFVAGDPTNPITILQHSPQPYKGLGLQAKNHLRGIEILLNEALTRLHE